MHQNAQFGKPSVAISGNLYPVLTLEPAIERRVRELRAAAPGVLPPGEEKKVETKEVEE